MEGRTDRHGGSYHMNLHGMACALVGGALWGFSGTAVSYLFRSSGIDPMWVMSVRMILAGILFLLFSVARGDRRPFELLRDKSAVRDLLLFAGAGLFLGPAEPAASARCGGCVRDRPTSAQASRGHRHDPCTRRHLSHHHRRGPLADGAAARGVRRIGRGRASPHPASPDGLPPRCLAFGLLAALGGAGLAVFPGKILSTYGVSAVNGWAMLLVGLIAAPFVPDWGQAVASFDISCWVVFGALVVLGTWCSYLFYMQGVHEIGSLKTAMLSTVEPISATVLSALWIGVVFSPTDLLGFAMIIIMMPLVA